MDPDDTETETDLEDLLLEEAGITDAPDEDINVSPPWKQTSQPFSPGRGKF